jgi:cobalamin biosynthesis protein CbiG
VRRDLAIDLALMVGAFVAATLVAELAGAANLGTALSFGQIAFALAAVFVVLRR